MKGVTQWLRVHAWASWIPHSDFNLLATSFGYQGTLVELPLLGPRWFQPPGKVFWKPGSLVETLSRSTQCFNFPATSSSKPGYTIRTLIPCTVYPLFGTLLGTVDPTFWTCPVLVQGHMCCAGAWFCTWRDHIHQGCTFFSAWWPETLSPCLAATCALVSVPQQVSYSSVTTWAFFLLNCYM